MPMILTRAELAQRWEYDIRSIATMEEEGFIHPLTGFRGKRYSLREIESMEGVPKEDRNLMSPFERRKLQEQIDNLSAENARLRKKIGAVIIAAGGLLQEEVNGHEQEAVQDSHRQYVR